jgi:hypothetical protein
MIVALASKINIEMLVAASPPPKVVTRFEIMIIARSGERDGCCSEAA